MELAGGLAALWLLHFVMGWRGLRREIKSPHYRSRDFIPAEVLESGQVRRWTMEAGEALVLWRGAQNEKTRSVIFVPGFSEDTRLGLLALRGWLLREDSARLTIVLKRGYSSPFQDADAPLAEPFPQAIPPLGEGYSVAQDAELVRALINVDPSDSIVLWGHSQGGATVQEALSERLPGGAMRLREELLPRLRAMVLEASVMPGSNFAPALRLPLSPLLIWPFLPWVPLGHAMDSALIGEARRRLRENPPPDLEQRLTIYDRNLYRFKSLKVAWDNARSLARFVREHERQELLRALARQGKLYGMFPERRDVILDTQSNLRVARSCAQLRAEHRGQKDPIWVLDQTHFMSLERPELAGRLLQKIWKKRKG